MSLIKVQNAHKSYISRRNGACKVLDGINLEVEDGCILGLLGRNGAGKTTLIKLIIGLIKSDIGEIEVLCKKQPEYRREIAGSMGVVLEGDRNLFWHMTILENIKFFIRLSGRSFNSKKDDIYELLRIFNLLDKKNNKIRTLSRGMRQKLSLILAYMTSPKVIIFDEPTIGLDVETTGSLIELFGRHISRKGTAAIICSHDMRFLKNLCNRIVFLHEGSLVYNKPHNSDSSIEVEKVFDIQLYDNLGKHMIDRVGLGCKIVPLKNEKGPSGLRLSSCSDENLLRFIKKIRNEGYSVKSIKESYSVDCL